MNELLPGDIGGGVAQGEEVLATLFPQRNEDASQKHRRLLYAPVLVSTIDHLMPSTESIRGGRYMLPVLRMMTADIVIDEIDDFTGSDLVAIARLTHLAGMLGRNVILSSATIPPDLAEGLFSAYKSGRKLYARFFGKSNAINCV
jgi:CRISPR-associated endonuclease/helicase Cas3